MKVKYDNMAKPEYAIGDKVEIVPLPLSDEESCRSFACYGERGSVTEIFAYSSRNVNGIIFRYLVGGNKFIPHNCCWREQELMRVA